MFLSFFLGGDCGAYTDKCPRPRKYSARSNLIQRSFREILRIDYLDAVLFRASNYAKSFRET